ncbi:pectinesterase-like [Panicum miliaceum]|uniref:Pectinesterase n=1 Tax=Panicum miliaceum TaxID=4540 RepID=A0A3L6RQM9_PANMI|nr:pectinesterase-like [Panicum miliaceum]
MATVLALATVAPVAAGKGDEAASGVGNAAAATSASAPPSSANVTLICRSTPDPSACETALTSAEAQSAQDPFAASVQFAMARATTARSLARNLSASAPAVPPSGMHDCAELLDISLAQLRDALAGCAADAAGATTWLSAALTNQGTCNDSLAAATAARPPAGRDAVRKQVAALARFIRTALALHVKKVKGGGRSGVPPSAAPSPNKGTAFPSWLPEHDRRLLESPPTNAMTPDAVVALDGSGTHSSINEAIAAVTAPVGTKASGGRGAGGSRRKVIHVKAGRYRESVSISYQQEDVMLVGDGKGKTIIDGDKSVGGGYTTYSSATLGTYVGIHKPLHEHD